MTALAVYCAGNQVVTRQGFPGHPGKVHEDGTPCGHEGWNRIGNREEREVRSR